MHCRGAQRVGSKSLASINSRFGHSLAGSQRGSTQRPPKIRREPPDATPEFGEQLKKLTNAFIQNASRTEGSGWKSNPDVPKIHHLRALVRTPNQPRAPSAEKETFFATVDETAEEELSAEAAASIPPSSFVEIRRNYCVAHGVVLGEVGTFLNSNMRILVSSGEIWEVKQTDVMYVIPCLVGKTTVLRSGLEDVATSDPQINARIVILKKLRELEKSIETIYPTIAGQLSPLLAQLEKRDPSVWGKLTLREVARDFLHTQTPLPITLLCVHKWLMVHPRTFVADPTNYLKTQAFSMRPRNEEEDLEFVIRATHRKEKSLEDFVEKVRTFVTATRNKKRITSGPPSIIPDQTTTFTETDQIFLRFLTNSLRTTRTTQKNVFLIPMSVIVKKTGLYPAERVDQAVVHKMLQELGILPPWDDPLLRDEKNNMEADSRTVMSAMPQTSLAEDEFYPQDIVEDLRHDFGALPVYVIDDHGASELDDGLSVEPCPSEPGTYWVHVHIADPTLLLHPSHKYSEHARRVLQTQYYTLGSDPMIPKDVVHQGLSLGSGSGETRVLSFSYKVDKTGDIVDYAVRPGIVRNLNVIRYSDVESVLDAPTTPIQYPFGRIFQPPEKFIPPSQVQDLKALYDTARSIQRKRLQSGCVVFSIPAVAPKLVSDLPPAQLNLTRPAEFQGFPAIDYAVAPYDSADRGARLLVAEAMRTACRVASRFFRDRGVPALRRVAGKLVMDEADLEQLQSMRNDIGYVDFYEVARRSGRVPHGEYSTSTRGHWQLGIPNGEGYVRVTSPLRRYGDMLAHWQIKQALLATKTREKPYIFSEGWLQEFGNRLGTKEHQLNTVSRVNDKFWAVKCLQAMMENPTDKAKEVFSSLVGRPVQTTRIDKLTGNKLCIISIPQLGIYADMLIHKSDTRPVQLGELCNVTIRGLRLGLRPKLEVTRV